MKQKIVLNGVDALLKELSGLGPDLNRQIRAASKKNSESEVVRLRAAATRSDRQSAAVGVSVRARADRLPSILAGGARRMNVSGAKGKERPHAGDIFFGAEFGGQKRKTTQQFRPHKKREGYWLWPQLRHDEAKLIEGWTEALELVLKANEGRL